ncbi:MAG: hypothetical protein IPN17_31250 [Deltaproteobacteria bacterium]|nr:hypothetical protein [Deltaproteobacteria bacterium]
MAHDAAPPVSPRGVRRAAAAWKQGQFAKTMMGGMASLDPASLGGGMIAPQDEGASMGHGSQANQVEAARTIAMDAASFGLPSTRGGRPVERVALPPTRPGSLLRAAPDGPAAAA